MYYLLPPVSVSVCVSAYRHFLKSAKSQQRVRVLSSDDAPHDGPPRGRVCGRGRASAEPGDSLASRACTPHRAGSGHRCALGQAQKVSPAGAAGRCSGGRCGGQRRRAAGAGRARPRDRGHGRQHTAECVCSAPPVRCFAALSHPHTRPAALLLPSPAVVQSGRRMRATRWCCSCCYRAAQRPP